MRYTISILAILMALTGCVTEDIPVNNGIEVGDKVPYFLVTLNNGETVSTDTLMGKVALIEFFNTTCPDCREAFPALNYVYEELKENPDIIIFAISREEDSTSIEKYWNDNGLTIPYSAQTDRSIYNLFATVGIPRTYITDKSGVITYAFGDSDIPSADTILEAIEESGK